MRGLLRGAIAAGALVLSTIGALAHPHIWIDANAIVTFNDAGEIVSIRNSWTFDEAFSVWQVQGLDTNGDGTTSSEEMQELADENIKGLAEYNFYTLAGSGEQSVRFVADGPARFDYEQNRSTLTFSIAPEKPLRVEGRFELAIADPEYYVDITFDGLNGLTFENAPNGCAPALTPPRELSPDLMARLGDLSADVTKLPPDLEVAVRGAQGGFVIDCSNAALPPARTAAEAATRVAETRPAQPFGGPPQEPGFRISPSGPLGWMVTAQEQFYRSLTAALGELRTDWTAFWVLGGLSFLYGLFHAAGPGHGKVVIASYLLANEHQVRRGVVLSFASGLLQALVAIAIVGVAAAILNLSTSAMDVAVVWIERGAYLLMALLGVWLVVRKLFGWGHSHAAPMLAQPPHAHAHAHDHAHARAHEHQHLAFQPAAATAGMPGGLDAFGRSPDDAHYGHSHGHGHDHHHPHDHDDHHHHVVLADQVGGDWREQLGVVLSSGLRPCTGALLVLVFALSQGVFAAGIASALLMGLGTAIAVSVLAILAVTAKGAARRLLGAGGQWGSTLFWWVELAGALAVLAFGLMLLWASL